jgi:hypothetical protein
MKTAMNECEQKSGTRGAIVFFSLFVIMAIVIVLAGLLAISRSVTVTSQTIDVVRQTGIEKQMLEDVVRRAVMSRIGVAGDNTNATTDATIDALLERLNAGTGIVVSRTFASPSLPPVRMFPDADVPPTVTPSPASGGGKFQLADLIGRRAARLTATPLVWHFSRAGSRSLENRTYAVEADVWAVPLVNWSLIAYGLPASGAVPSAAPSGIVLEKWLSSVQSNAGHPLVLTTLKSGSASEGGDPTAFGTLYRKPHDAGQEILPRYYQNIAAVAWDAWEFVWGKYLVQLAGNASASGMFFDLALPLASPPASLPPGIEAGENGHAGELVVDLDLVPGGVLALMDSIGGRIVNLGSDSAAAAPLVVVVLNYTSIPTVVNFSGNNSRALILYACNADVRFAGNATFNGGLFLDKTSTLAGTGTINGTVAFYASAGNPLSGATDINLFPSPSPTDALESISPRVVLVSTKSRLN